MGFDYDKVCNLGSCDKTYTDMRVTDITTDIGIRPVIMVRKRPKNI